METIIFASNNKNKIKEVKNILKDYNILSLNDIEFFDDIVEDGKTLKDNALIKLRETKKYMDKKGIKGMILADDTGLCVDSLNGQPGVYSARYAGDHNHQANRDKLLRELKDKENRDAHFSCCIAFLDKNGNEKTFEGRVEGKILEYEHGSTEFGYDCLFYSNELKKCFGQCSQEEKNSVSHRGRALKKLEEYLSDKI